MLAWLFLVLIAHLYQPVVFNIWLDKWSQTATVQLTNSLMVSIDAMWWLGKAVDFHEWIINLGLPPFMAKMMVSFAIFWGPILRHTNFSHFCDSLGHHFSVSICFFCWCNDISQRCPFSDVQISTSRWLGHRWSPVQWRPRQISSWYLKIAG